MLLDFSGHLIVVWDFNFHVDVHSDPDAQKLPDILETLNCSQLTHNPTHRTGDILDFIGIGLDTATVEIPIYLIPASLTTLLSI